MASYPVSYLKNNPSLAGLARILPEIVFTSRERDNLHLLLTQPWRLTNEAGEKIFYPTVVFVQGSGWTSPNLYANLPQISQLARQGYIVASISHRSALDGHRAPAFLQDVKTAVRFLRAKADFYHIDPERIGIWGTSSGGNAALLTAMTPDDPRYRTDEWEDYSDEVKFAIDCFGPTDIAELIENIQEELEDSRQNLARLAFGKRTLAEEEQRILRIGIESFLGQPDGSLDLALARAISPLHILEKDKSYPPFLILHGSKDSLVAYEQSFAFYQKLVDLGADARMVSVEGGVHEDNFWSQKLLDLIWAFIAGNI